LILESRCGEAAEAEHRSLTNLILKLLTDYARKAGYLEAGQRKMSWEHKLRMVVDAVLIEAMDRHQAVVNPMNIAAKIRAENPNIIARAEMDDASINALVLRRLKTLYEIPIREWRETTNRILSEHLRTITAAMLARPEGSA
jgi:hypothetical protein